MIKSFLPFALAFTLLSSCSNDPNSLFNTLTNPAIDPESLNTLEKEMYDDVKEFVQAGFYGKKQMEDTIRKMFFNETIDMVWVKKMVAQQYKQKLAEEAMWPKTTDCDRLAAVFDRLNAMGVISLHYMGASVYSGADSVQNLFNKTRAKGIKTIGCCFYTKPDVPKAIESKNLFLYFGNFDGSMEGKGELASKIMSVLHQYGFMTHYNDRLDPRIAIVGFIWRKRFDNKNFTNKHAEQILLVGK